MEINVTSRLFQNKCNVTFIRLLVAIGPDKFVFQKNRRQFSNKDFPRGQVSGFADNLDFEKFKTWDRIKTNTADPSHF